jgi:CRP/FNR family transcriptional regulator
VRGVLLPDPEVTHLASLRRAASLFAQDQSAEACFFIEDGLVKLTRKNTDGDRIILTIRGPGQLLGEEALSHTQGSYYAEAEILTTADLIRIPRYAMQRAISSNPDLSAAIVDELLQRRLALAMKVELLCLHDVEYRILYYLAELSALVKPLVDGEGYQIPITQLELADLIGATRETTSTTLNQLERRGLLKLSRRMLTVPSESGLRAAAAKNPQPAAIASQLVS